jgi:hypothetical protein
MTSLPSKERRHAVPRGRHRPRGTVARDRRFSPATRFQERDMPRSKMKGDNSADSKGADSEARGSGGTTKKSQNPGKQSNQKAANTKSNKQ